MRVRRNVWEGREISDLIVDVWEPYTELVRTVELGLALLPLKRIHCAFTVIFRINIYIGGKCVQWADILNN
jgi:hypothetical protein